MRVIYIDELFLLNLVFDYFLLLATAKICSSATKRRRITAAALFGSIYVVLSVLPGFEVLLHPAGKLASGVVMLLITFGFAKKFLRIALVFFAVTAAGAGAVAAISQLAGNQAAKIDLKLLIVTFIICYAAVTLVFNRAARAGQRFASLEIISGNNKIVLRALIDTGNSLRDSVTMRPAAVITAQDASMLFSKETRHSAEQSFVKNAEDAILELSRLCPEIRFRLLPYGAVGKNGMLVSFAPEKILIDGKARDIIVAVSPNAISDNAAYDAIIPEIN